LFGGGGDFGLLHGVRAFADGDTYLALPGGFKWLDYYVSVWFSVSQGLSGSPAASGIEEDRDMSSLFWKWEDLTQILTLL
jgi:hypothetical protein